MIQDFNFLQPKSDLNYLTDDEKLKWVVQTQIAPTPLARSAYCEEMIQNTIMLGTTQYVILGAGMDTYAYRSQTNLTIFEVDYPATQSFKQQRIKEVE